MSSLPYDEKDYRSVLRKWVTERPNRGRGELKAMAEKLGVPSPVFSQMLSGSRELTEDHAYLLCEHMGFSDLQQEYFLCLVQIARAAHPQYIEHLKKKRQQIRDHALAISAAEEEKQTLNEKDQAEFYSSWIYAAIHLFCDMNPKGTNFEEIQKEFNLPKDRLTQILDFLIRVRLLEIKSGNYKTGPIVILVDDSPFIYRHHSNWRLRAMERSANLRPNELMLTAPLAISEKDFWKLREKMLGFIGEVQTTIEDTQAEKLVCFNMDLFEVK